jgi:hypothetical protein
MGRGAFDHFTLLDAVNCYDFSIFSASPGLSRHKESKFASVFDVHLKMFRVLAIHSRLFKSPELKYNMPE